MNFALIGCGRIAVNHIKAVVENKLNMVAACDLQIQNINNLFNKTNFDQEVSKYTNYEQMIEEHPELELISIATDSGSHAEIALYCINKGINVIIEKPMTMSMKDANSIVDLAKEKNVKVSVCHQNRFNLAVQQMRQALESDRFGKLSHGTIHVRWNRGKEYYNQAKWRGKWATDGGCLFNQCIHGIDLLRWMIGNEIDEVYGVTKQQFHDYLECEDVGMALVKFKNGALGTIEGTVNVFPHNLEETLYVFGEKGTAKLGGKSTNNIDVWEFEDEQIDDKENRALKEKTTNVYGNGHTSLYADMMNAIDNDRDPYITATDGKNAVELILAIYQSAAINKPVKLPLDNVSSTDFEGRFE